MGKYFRGKNTAVGTINFEDGSKADFKSGSELEADDSSTLDFDVELDMDVAMTATGEIANFTGTINHATASAEGLDVTLTQLTTSRTGGVLSGIKTALTSLAGDSGGTYNNFEATVTDGGGTATHNAILIGAGFDAALTADTADLTISTTTSGALAIDAVALLDVNAGANLDVDVTGTVDILATGVLSIDSTGASNLSATSGNLTVSTLTTGTLILDSVALLDMNAGANIDIDVTGSYDMLASGVFSIDGTGASNVSATSGNLSLQALTAGSVLVDGADGVLIESASGALGIGVDAVAEAVNIGTGAAARAIAIGNAASASLSMEGGVGAVSLQGDTTLAIDAGTALTVESAGGAISIGADAVAQAVNVATGGAARVITIGNALSASLTMEGGVGGIDIDCDTTFDVLAGGAVSIDGTGACNLTAAAGNLTLGTTTSGGVGIQSQDAVDITTLDRTAGGAAADSAAMTITTGTRVTDDAVAGTPGSGALTIGTGLTNCTDGVGTAGDSGALTVQTGDADSDAGTGGDSGALTIETGFSDDAASGDILIQTGSADTTSGDITIDVGAAGATAGDVVIGTTAVLVNLDANVKFNAAGGADSAAALLGGVGTTGTPATTAVPNNNMLEFRVQTTATSGEFRGLYVNAAYDGAGVAGDSIRGRATIAEAVAGTVAGGAFTMEYASGGSVTGQGVGCRGNVVLPDAAVTGTLYGGLSELYASGASTDVSGTTSHALHSFQAIGNATGAATVAHCFDIQGADGSGDMCYDHVVTAPGAAGGSIKISVNGATGYLYWWDTEGTT